jgi:hypothetical protein
MSLPKEAIESDGIQSQTKLVDEYFVFYLPTLGAVFGERNAVFLQKIHLLLQEPYHRDRRLETAIYQKRKWVRIEDWLLWDEIEGMMPGLGGDTASYRMRKDLEREGVLLQTRKLNTDRSDTTNWFTIHYQNLTGKLRERETRIAPLRDRRKEERRILNRIAEERGRSIEWKPGILETLSDYLTTNDVQFLKKLGTRQFDGCDPSKAVKRPKRPKRPVKLKPQDLSNCQVSSANLKESSLLTEESLDSSNTTTTDAIASDSVGVDENSKEFLEEQTPTLEHQPQEVTTPKQKSTSQAKQNKTPSSLNFRAAPSEIEVPPIPPLPGTAVHNILETGAPPVVGADALALRLQTWAKGEGYAVDTERALRIVAQTKIADASVLEISKDALSRRLGADHADMGLPDPIGPNVRRKLEAEPEHLRWMLWTWPMHRADIKESSSPPDPCTCFVARAGYAKGCKGEESSWKPKSTWIERLLREDEARAQKEAARQQEETAETFWAAISTGLPKGQLAALEAELKRQVFRRVGEVHPGKVYTEGTDQYVQARIWVLTYPRTRAILAGFFAPSEIGPEIAQTGEINQNGAASSEKPTVAPQGAAKAPTKVQTPAEDEKPPMTELQFARLSRSMDFYIRQVADGKMKIDDLDFSREGVTPEQAQWFKARIQESLPTIREALELERQGEELKKKSKAA